VSTRFDFRICQLTTFILGVEINKLLPYANDHFGLVTLAHALKVGISKSAWYRAVHAGLIDLLHPGVGRLVGAPDSREQRILSAVLSAGSGALASHRSAAHLWGIPRPENDPVDILFPPRRRMMDLTDVLAHRPRDAADLKRVLRSRIPTTNILRTLCDLGAVDPAAVPGAVGHALTTGLATVGALDRAIARHSERGRHGIVAFRNALQDWRLDGKPPDSVLELEMRRLFHDFRLPPAEFHAVIEGYEVDFWIVGSPVIVECDGWTTHGLSKCQFESDRDRDADLTGAGFVTVRRTYRQITSRRAETARKIENAIRRWAPDLLPATG
jgi:very-short-patch-repair endonuclease